MKNLINGWGENKKKNVLKLKGEWHFFDSKRNEKKEEDFVLK